MVDRFPVEVLKDVIKLLRMAKNQRSILGFTFIYMMLPIATRSFGDLNSTNDPKSCSSLKYFNLKEILCFIRSMPLATAKKAGKGQNRNQFCFRSFRGMQLITMKSGKSDDESDRVFFIKENLKQPYYE